MLRAALGLIQALYSVGTESPSPEIKAACVCSVKVKNDINLPLSLKRLHKITRGQQTLCKGNKAHPGYLVFKKSV